MEGGACFRLEWHYCSLQGRKEPGQRKPSKIQGREGTVGGARPGRPPDWGLQRLGEKKNKKKMLLGRISYSKLLSVKQDA